MSCALQMFCDVRESLFEACGSFLEAPYRDTAPCIALYGLLRIPDQGLCLNSFHCYAKPCDGRAHAPLASCGIPKTCSKKKAKNKK